MAEYKVERLKRIRVLEEATTAFAINKSGSGTYSDIDAFSIEMGRATEMLDNDALQQRKDATEHKIPFRRRCTANFGIHLKGTGTAISGTAAPSVSSQMMVVKTVMGGLSAASSSIVAAGSDADTLVTGSGGNNSFRAGQVVGLLSGSSGQIETNRIQNIVGTSVHMHTQFTFSPTTGQTIYGSQTAYLTQDASGSLQLLAEGASSQSKYVLMGLNGGFTLETALGALLKASFDLQGADWATGSAGALGVATYQSTVPRYGTATKVWFQPAPTSATAGIARVQPVVAALSLTPNIGYEDIEDYDGVNNIVGKIRKSEPPVCSGQLDLFFGNHNHTFQDALDDETEYSLLIQYGTTAGNIVVICLPRVQITEVTPTGVNNKEGLQVKFECLEDDISEPTASNTDLARSAMTISWL